MSPVSETEILLPIVPTRGYIATLPRTEVPLDALCSGSTNWLVPRRKLRRRAGSAIFGDTWSGGHEVSGIVEGKWGGLTRRLLAVPLASLADGYRTLLGLMTEEAALKAGQLFFRNTNGTNSWRVVGQEWGTAADPTHYPNAPIAQPGLSIVPFVYDNEYSGGMTLTRLKREKERRYLAGGSRDVRQFGTEICLPGYTGTPLRWNGRYNHFSDAGSEKCEVFPLGLIPPLQVPIVVAGTDLGTSTVGPWKGDDAFFYTVIFENERGEWSMWPIPRPPNSAWVGFAGFGYKQVGTTLHYYDRVTFTGIACGPPGTKRRHILRTTKVDVAATSGAVFPPLNSLGICATLENNTETSYVLDEANDLSLNFDPRIIEMIERGQQWPPRAQHMGRFDGHATIGKLRPHPGALILAPWDNGDVNAPISGLTPNGDQVLYGSTAYGVRVESTRSDTTVTSLLRLREVTGNNETDVTYALGQFNLRALLDTVMTNSTTSTAVHDCSFPGFPLLGPTINVDADESPTADIEVGMHVVHALIPEAAVVTRVWPVGSDPLHPTLQPIGISLWPTASFSSQSVTFWKNVSNTTSPNLWGIGVVPGADAQESADELLRTYVPETATWDAAATTLTLASALLATHITPGMQVKTVAGTHFTATGNGTVVTAVNTTTGVVTFTPAASLAGAAVAVQFCYDTGDEAALDSSDQNGYGFVRAFGNALPAPLYWRKSYLDQFTPDLYASQFSAASPGYPQDAVNTWHRKNRHSGPAEFGPLIGMAECYNAQLEFHAHGIVQLCNPRDQDTHEDADYRKTVVDWGHGASSPYGVASTGGCVVYANEDGVFARSLGLQKVCLSEAIYDPGRPLGSRGVLEYALLGDSTHVGSCASADSGADTFKIFLSIVAGVVHLRYFSANTVTYPDREIRYDFSKSVGREGLAEVLDDEGRPYPWSTPLTLRASTSCLLTKADGIHHYAAIDSNAGVTDGHVDEIDSGYQDNGAAVAATGYTGVLIPGSLDETQPLRLGFVGKKVITPTGLTVAVGANPEVAPASDVWIGTTITSSGSNDYHREILTFGSNVRSARQSLAFRIADDGTSQSATDWPEISRLVIYAEPQPGKPNK